MHGELLLEHVEANWAWANENGDYRRSHLDYQLRVRWVGGSWVGALLIASMSTSCVERVL